MSNMSKPPLVVPRISRREILISAAVALVVVLFFGLGLFKMGDRIKATQLTGVIQTKTFTPKGEDQVTFGSKGVHVRRIEGEYVLEVRVGEREYLVPVEKEVYEARKVGEPFQFVNPEPVQ